MNTLIVLLVFIALASITYLWVQGIHNIHDEYPDYDGREMYDEDDGEWEEDDEHN